MLDAKGIDRGWAVLWLNDLTAAVGPHLFLCLTIHRNRSPSHAW